MKGPYSGTYSGTYLECHKKCLRTSLKCPKNDLGHPKKCVRLSKKHERHT